MEVSAIHISGRNKKPAIGMKTAAKISLDCHVRIFNTA
jgi:hypothetical protein